MTKSAVRLLAAVLLCGIFAVPAAANSITLNSTNCSTPTACYGLSWTLTVNSGAYTYNGVQYGYQVLLEVEDDPAITGTPSVTISAVNFKISSTTTAAVLYQVPVSTLLSTWSTSLTNLGSAGCGSSAATFVCSQSATDPANFVASSTNQIWGWYVNSGTLFTGLEGAHIGAKLVALGTPGRLLSEEYHVPEPGSLVLLVVGFAAVGLTSRQRGRQRQNVA